MRAATGCQGDAQQAPAGRKQERACCCCKHGGPTPNGNTCGWGLLERPQVPLGVSVPRPVSPDLPFPGPHRCPPLSASQCPSAGSPTLQHQVGRARRLNLGACPLLTRPCPFLPSLMRPHFLWQEPPPSPGLGKKEPPGRSRRKVPRGGGGSGSGPSPHGPVSQPLYQCVSRSLVQVRGGRDLGIPAAPGLRVGVNGVTPAPPLNLSLPSLPRCGSGEGLCCLSPRRLSAPAVSVRASPSDWCPAEGCLTSLTLKVPLPFPISLAEGLSC